MARVAPTAIVFIACVAGISHNEIEDAIPDDLTAGCGLLLNPVLEAAGGPVIGAYRPGWQISVSRPPVP